MPKAGTVTLKYFFLEQIKKVSLIIWSSGGRIGVSYVSNYWFVLQPLEPCHKQIFALHNYVHYTAKSNLIG